MTRSGCPRTCGTRLTGWPAGEGYLAVAPDLFAGRRKLVCMISVMHEVRARQGKTSEDIEASRAWLVGREGCTGRSA